MTEISNTELDELKKKYEQVEELKYKDFVNECLNPQEIPSRRKYYTGRCIYISIKSSKKEFWYKIRLTIPDVFTNEEKLKFIDKEIRRQLAVDLNKW